MAKATRCWCGCAKSTHCQNNSHRTEKGACTHCDCTQYQPDDVPNCCLCGAPVFPGHTCDTAEASHA